MPEWLEQIPIIGCRCGKLTAPQQIDVTMQSEDNFAILMAHLFDNRKKLVKGGTILNLDLEIIGALGRDAFEKCFYLGKVDFVERKGRREFVSLIPRFESSIVFTRGENVEFFFCRVCKDFPCYGHSHPFKPYVLSKDVEERLPLYPSVDGSFLLRGDLLPLIQPFRKTIHLKEIPIRDEPADDLPGDLFSLPRDFRKNRSKPK